MKRVIWVSLVVFGLFKAGAADLQWLTDFPKAQQNAKAESKLLMLDFSGSDWCGQCIKYRKEVFSTSEFEEYASKHLVLVEVDFPKKKHLSSQQRKANDALQDKLAIEEYPTIVLMTAAGKELGRFGYIAGGVQPFLAKLESLKAGRVTSR